MKKGAIYGYRCTMGKRTVVMLAVYTFITILMTIYILSYLQPTPQNCGKCVEVKEVRQIEDTFETKYMHSLVRLDAPAENMQLPNATAYNMTPEWPSRILYNRIPKCGSTTLSVLFKLMCKSASKDCSVYHSNVFNRQRIDLKQQKQYVDYVMGDEGPSVFDRHVHFINFTDFQSENPAYINMVRDPMDRLISSYYFLRVHLTHMYNLSKADRHRTYDECVQGNYSKCVSDKASFRIIPYFCGHDRRCLHSKDFALAQAKSNVNKHYSLVGYLEEMASFLRLLEQKFPSYFKNIYMMYLTHEKQLKLRFKTKKKVKPQEKTIQIMKSKLKHEYDFYQFIKQKFHNTWNQLFKNKMQ